MPKRRRDRSTSFETSKGSSLHCCSGLSSESNLTDPSTNEKDVKEWEDARCPVCIEHPHNAVLLICSSYHKGCRPYMCDTSYRHSNCLDQFRKSFTKTLPETPGEGVDQIESSLIVSAAQDDGKSKGALASEHVSGMQKFEQKLVCPLCRGQISGWTVVNSARSFMNSKRRSCACESCNFIGTYTELRKHARSDHPRVRPSKADPERQRSWNRRQRESDIDEVMSSIESLIAEDQNGDAPRLNDQYRTTLMQVAQFFGPRTNSWLGSSTTSGE